jgi:hypothetical protein
MRSGIAHLTLTFGVGICHGAVPLIYLIRSVDETRKYRVCLIAFNNSNTRICDKIRTSKVIVTCKYCEGNKAREITTVCLYVTVCHFCNRWPIFTKRDVKGLPLGGHRNAVLLNFVQPV